MTLRRGLIILALFVAIVATWQIEGGQHRGLVCIAVAALIVVGALVFERPRYRPTGDLIRRLACDRGTLRRPRQRTS